MGKIIRSGFQIYILMLPTNMELLSCHQSRIQNAVLVVIWENRPNAEIAFHIALKTWFGQFKNLSDTDVSSWISHILNIKRQDEVTVFFLINKDYTHNEWYPLGVILIYCLINQLKRGVKNDVRLDEIRKYTALPCNNGKAKKVTQIKRFRSLVEVIQSLMLFLT